MSTMEKVRSYFMSGVKGYGLRYTREDRVYEVIAVVFAVGGLVGFMCYPPSPIGYGFLVLMCLGYVLSLVVGIRMLKRRIRELGGDTQKPIK